MTLPKRASLELTNADLEEIASAAKTTGAGVGPVHSPAAKKSEAPSDAQLTRQSR